MSTGLLSGLLWSCCVEWEVGSGFFVAWLSSHGETRKSSAAADALLVLNRVLPVLRTQYSPACSSASGSCCTCNRSVLRGVLLVGCVSAWWWCEGCVCQRGGTRGVCVSAVVLRGVCVSARWCCEGCVCQRGSWGRTRGVVFAAYLDSQVHSCHPK